MNESSARSRLALLAFAQLIIAIDFNIVYVALPDIGRELGFSTQSLQWVVSAYAVGFGGFLLLGGRAADRFGARRLFVFGLLLFGLACLAGGLAVTPAMLMAARAVQGLGAALLTPAMLALVYANFAEGPERTRAMGVWGAAGSGGLAAGSLLGGVLTNYLGWEWVFFVLTPLALGAAALAPRVLPADPRRADGGSSFDLPGAVTATAGSSLVVFGLANGPDAGWGSARSAGALVAGAALLGVFVLIQSRTRDPLVPPRMVRNRSLATAVLVILIFQSALLGTYYVLTTYLQGVLGYSALEAGLAFLPLTLVSMFASLRLTGLAISRWGVRVALFAGMGVNAVGSAVLLLGMSADGSFWALVPGIVIWGIGGGTTFPAMFVAAGSGVAPDEQGVASGLATTSQQIGGAVGLAILLAIANAGLNHHAGTPGPTATQVVAGLHTALWVAAAAQLVGALVALTIKGRPVAGVPAAATDTLDVPA
ncbi:MFS transporter [Actinomadura roseirufa]|uniref:MFS transporter n=1 Tax=Actinomadura roseirufa TaxID=2094049 RepID=UPI001040E6AF|nr:MFS transporter [Actinomadura roseirufa]